MVEHLVKPFSAEELLTVVERVAVRCPLVTLREPPTFDSDVLAQLAPYMSSDDMERHLLDLTRKVEAPAAGDRDGRHGLGPASHR